tara:strand:- start:203 stop:424 length:222 start_codon:yes stop_codon:yes gene_type:complete
MSNKRYNPEDFKDAEFITVGDGPVRVQIVKAKNLNMGDIVYISKKLFEIECEMGLIKTMAEESADKGEKAQTI